MKLNNSTSSVSPMSGLFDATLKRYRISAKELSKLTGISENHISEFRRSKGDVSTLILHNLLNGMDNLAGGSKQYFLDLLSNQKDSNTLKQSLVDTIAVADEEELLSTISAIAERFRILRNSTDDSLLQYLVEIQ
jgi:transcriptional regulator with XRE-family HTH domain